MPYSPSSADLSTSSTPYPRVTTKTNSTPHPKMGFQLNGVENVGTAVSSNDSTTIVNQTRNRRPHGEYIALESGEIYFVNTQGQIGRIKGGDIKLLEKAHNYFSWGGSVPCNGDIEREDFYPASLSDILDGVGAAKILTRRCVYDDGPYKNYRPSTSAQCSPGDLIRPFKDNIVGFQTSENTCAIFRNGTCIYRGQFDGRRFPVEFNWKDWAYAGDPKIPNLNGGGITRGQAFIPELDAHGKIKWMMPKQSAIIVGGPSDADGNETINLEHLPSPIPQLHKVPTWLIWRHWFYPHPFSIVKHGLFTNPYEHPGYTATNFIKYRSYRWVSCTCEEVCGEACYVVNYTDEYFIGMKGGQSEPKVDDNAVVSESELVAITANCVHEGSAQGALKPWCPACPPTGEPVPQPCTIQRPLYKTEVVCTYFDFPPDVPFMAQIQGFAIGTVERNPYSAELAGFTICTKQPLFSSCKESRYVGQGTLPKHFPFDWSLVTELGYDIDTPLQSDWYVDAEKSGGDRLQWWQNYIESFFLYQSKPLSAFVVSIPTPHDSEGGTYANYVNWEVNYSGDMSKQIRPVTGKELGDYVPLWLSFSRYKRIPTSIPGIYQPQDRYTFDVRLEPGAAPIIARLNMTPGDSSLTSEPDIKDLLASRAFLFTQFLTDWNQAVLSHPIGSENFGSGALRLKTAQRNAVSTAANQVFAETSSLNLPVSHLSEATNAIHIAVQRFLNAIISEAFSSTESSYEYVRAGILSESEYQLRLNSLIFSGLTQSDDSIKNAINEYIDKALTDNTHGLCTVYNQTVRTYAREYFRQCSDMFDPFWVRTPFLNLEINGETESLTFTERFRKKLFDSLQNEITGYVDSWNTSHESQISASEITSLINTWFDESFLPTLEWHISEPQPQFASSLSFNYLSEYSYDPDFLSPQILPRLVSVTIPSIIPLIHSPSYSIFTHIAHERLGQEMIPQLLALIEKSINIGLQASIVSKYGESELVQERKKMIGLDPNADNSAISCSREYFQTVLGSCYSDALAQLPS